MNIEPASRLMLLRRVEVIRRVKIEAFTKSSWLYRDKAGMFELLPTADRILLQRLVNFVVIVKASMTCLVVHWNKMRCLDGLYWGRYWGRDWRRKFTLEWISGGYDFLCLFVRNVWYILARTYKEPHPSILKEWDTGVLLCCWRLPYRSLCSPSNFSESYRSARSQVNVWKSSSSGNDCEESRDEHVGRVLSGNCLQTECYERSLQ